MKPVTKGRGGESGEPAFVPTREWVQAFRSQWTPELALFARRYARTQCRKVALVRAIDESFAVEMVQDIIGDTMLGVIAWDPDRVSLKKHVLDAIMSRSRHAYVHALKFRPLQLEAVVDEAERKLEEEHAPLIAAIAFAEEVLRTLRTYVSPDDSELNRILDAYEQGVTKRFDVLRLTKLSAKQYDAARHRLKRLVDLLPATLRPAAPE